jgi:hypothetical protein
MGDAKFKHRFTWIPEGKKPLEDVGLGLVGTII